MAGASVALFTAMSTTAQAADTVKWDMPNEYGATSIPAEADRLFADRVKEKSGGQIVITNHFGGSLGYKSRDHWSAVEDGAVPIASTYTGVFSGIDPIFQLQSLPFVATDPKEAKALLDAMRPWLEQAFAKGGQKYLLGAPWTPVGIWAKKEITDAEGLRNLKIRSYDKTGTLTLKNAGAAAIQLSWADVVPALSTGTIEAVLTSDEGGLSAKFYEYMDHFHHVGFTMGTNMIHVSQAAFDALSPEQQKVVLDAAAEVEGEAWANINGRIELNIKRLNENGVTSVTSLPASFLEHLRTSGDPVTTEWKEVFGEEEADKIFARYNELKAQ
ncbi:MAG: TRAP transporter substrate-binding protein [Gammaproteobacteria bacterium]